MTILHDADLPDMLAQWKKDGKRIVTTNGCFDILHPGHIETFRIARSLGDILIVLVNSDRNPYFGTKPGRPINPEAFRLAILDSIRFVDYVALFDEETPVRLLDIIAPDFHVKWGDYRPEELPEYSTVVSQGGEIRIVETIQSYSSSNTIKQILHTYRDDPLYNP